MIIFLTVLTTILTMLIMFMFFLVVGLHTRHESLMTRLIQLHATSQEQTRLYTELAKYISDLTTVVENLSQITHDLGVGMFENSFKMVRDGGNIFGGFSPDEIANKMNKTEQYDLSDEDINELRKLFMDMDDEELDDEEEV
jgi:hypothetical protein